jgi:antitoxin (DNA-binding transcriptional repressor) of toxin-antitoxin stability system
MRKTATLRELHLKTGEILAEVAEGQSYVIRRKGVIVAEIRPLDKLPPTTRLPDREEYFKSLPLVKTDSGRILEEDRT